MCFLIEVDDQSDGTELESSVYGSSVKVINRFFRQIFHGTGRYVRIRFDVDADTLRLGLHI